MYIGHFAPAFVAAGAAPEAPRLGALFAAAQLVDLAFMGFVMVGLEHMRVVPGFTAMNPLDLYDMPLTHSLIAGALWGLAFGAVVWRRTRRRTAGAWAAMVVLSHWFVDLLVHRPGLTLTGQAPKLGLGLWDWPLVAMPLELALIGLSFWFYLSRTRGPIGPPLILMAVMLMFQAINWFAPQPESYSIALPLTALLSYIILILLARWVGTTRRHKHAAGLAMASYRR